jgi:hypothetical protein
MAQKPQQVIEGEVASAQELETQLATLESALAGNEQFQQFLAVRNQLNEKYGEIRKKVADVMIPAYQAGEVDKSLKGDWGSVTVTERDDFDIDEAALPAKFFKKVPDTTRIRKTFQLEGVAPKGTVRSVKYGIMIKFKKEG